MDRWLTDPPSCAWIADREMSRNEREVIKYIYELNVTHTMDTDKM